MTKYRILEPEDCFNCGGKCHARKWFHYTTTGKPYYPIGKAAVYWQCSQCGRRFETLEYVDAIMIEVDEIPQTPYPLTYIEIKGEE